MPHEGPVTGRSVVTRRAILDIVKTAVQGSYGVTGFADRSLPARLRRWFGMGTPGVKLSTQEGLTLDLYLTVAYGVPVAEVARQVDSAVRYAIRRATGVEIGCLSIHVDGLRYQPMPPLRPAGPADEEVAPDGDEPETE